MRISLISMSWVDLRGLLKREGVRGILFFNLRLNSTVQELCKSLKEKLEKELEEL